MDQCFSTKDRRKGLRPVILLDDNRLVVGEVRIGELAVVRVRLRRRALACLYCHCWRIGPGSRCLVQPFPKAAVILWSMNLRIWVSNRWSRSYAELLRSNPTTSWSGPWS